MSSATTAEKPGRLLDTAEVGRRLGGACPSDVLHLIRTGKLAAKSLVIRGEGKRPRKYVLESELERYIQNLPDANGAAVPAPEPPKRERGRREKVKTEYY